MPDLDELFAGLSVDADRVPSPELAAIVARGRQRGLRSAMTAAVAALVVLLVTGTVITAGRTGRDAVEPAGPGPFHGLRAVGTGLDFPVTPGQTPAVATAIDGGRGYAVWTVGGEAFAGAVDLRTGAVVWGPRAVYGRGPDDFVIAAGGVLAVVADTPGSTDTTPQALTVLDPATGTVLWTTVLELDHTRPLLFPSVLVLADSRTGITTALDWHTGVTRWTVTDPSHGLADAIGMLTRADVVAGNVEGLRFTDPRLIESGTDGVLRLYDSGTGRLERARPAPPGPQAIGYDGSVYSVTGPAGATPRQVFVTDLTSEDPARLIYTTTRPPVTGDVPLAPCGNDLICLVDGRTDATSTQVVAIDPANGTTAWRMPSVGGANALLPLGYVVLGYDNGTLALYGPGLARVLVLGSQGGFVRPVDAGDLLALVPVHHAVGSSDATARPTVVSGIVGLGAGLAPLGTVNVAPGMCSSDATTLFCPTDTGLRVWRFSGP